MAAEGVVLEIHRSKGNEPMPISVKCCDCGKALKAPDALAGKKAKCPDCGAVVVVPGTSGGGDANVELLEDNTGA